MSLGITEEKAARWRGRFIDQGRTGIEQDAPGRGRKPTYPPEIVAMVVRRTTRQKPEAATHWSRRVMARATELSPSTIGRIWRQHGLKPHLSRTFKISNDPHFARNWRTSSGSILRRRSMRWSCAAMKRARCRLWIAPSRPADEERPGQHLHHDYVRHGTTTLFAALNVADGTVIGQCQARHRHIEWLKFLRLLDEQTPADRDLHLILDNYATHNIPRSKPGWRSIRGSSALHPDERFVVNMVERFFRDLTPSACGAESFAACPS